MKKSLTMRLLAMFMCLAMLTTVTPVFVSADDSTLYLRFDESTGKVDRECYVSVDNVIKNGITDSFVTGWNIVKGNVVFEKRIVLPENVRLILADGATLTAIKGITVAEDGDFSVYAQSNDFTTMGKLVVLGLDAYNAGIGGTNGSDCGNITIYGGAVSAQGGNFAAAIGSGYNGNCAGVTIYGGMVNAGAGYGAAGIGSGYEASSGAVTIMGGYIKAECGEGAQPIGAGVTSDAVSVSIDPSCMATTLGTIKYINIVPIAGQEPTCTENGFKECYLNPVNKNYYESFPFAEDGLIGDDDALIAWQLEGGDGYIASLGHDWQYTDDESHTCRRCKITDGHMDINQDGFCDKCGTSVNTSYLGYNETTGKVDRNIMTMVENVIDEETDTFVTGWNIVKGNVEFKDRIVLPKDVKLILANGATLIADKGITVATDGDFAVYAQSTEPDVMGKLVVPDSVDTYNAGIGSGNGDNCCSIAIYGGIVTVNGGYGAAGIGSGYFEASCGSITISGGIVTANGGFSAAGIGSGFNSSCGDITISDGQVIARGGEYGFGIGVGGGINSSCDKVSITGGYIKATAETGDFIKAEQVSIDSSFEKCYTADTLYINCILVEETEAGCTNVGALAYFKDSINGLYYTDFPFSEGELIGDADALAMWKAEGGAGHKANPLGHEWQYDDGDNHICQRCKKTEPHRDENEDRLCDVCGATITTYLDYNETTGQADLSRIVGVNNIITDGTTDSFVSGWNIVRGNVTFENRIVLPKDVTLILADGATLTAKKGITVAENGDFAVYAQSTNPATMGKLIVPEDVEDNCAGIGGDYGKNCGNISIYGGHVTASGGYGAAGIGSGYNGNCASVTIYDGYVTADGGYGAAGIGDDLSGVSFCYKVTIMGGHIKATPGAFGTHIEAEEVLIDDSLVSLAEGNSRYVNCKVSAVEPTCTDSGFLEYFIDPVSGYYYTAFPFSEEGIIGGNTALAIWKAKGGDGYIAPLGHDWQYYDTVKHTCQRCKATGAHTDGNEDGLCDMCGAEHTIRLEYNEISGQVDLPQSVWANVIADGTTDSFVQGWNIVEGNVTFEERIVLPANVNLILADGATLTAKKGITVAKNGNFDIYAQSTDMETMGELIVPDGVEDNYPGIGSSDEEDCGDITIRGGVVTVTGGATGAGIGSGLGRRCGNISISSGFVTARGGYGAAGIGSGEGADCGRVMISGGTVTASSGYGAAGIGSGLVSSCEGVVMSGGTVIAQGGERAAGIGSGYASSCGRVSLSAAIVKATAGGSVADPIGSGELADLEVEVNMLLARTSTRTDNVQYVNCELFPETEADCSTIGALAYFRDSVRGLYYTDFPFTADVLIGDDDALSAWKGVGGAGHKANAWGHNLAYVAGDTHTCARCGFVENHMDENKDGMCDVCSAPLTMHLGYNETTGKADQVYYAYVEHVIDEATDSFASGWNIVKGNVTFDERISLPGEVHLILEDGATLTAKKGITVSTFGDFSIYAQSADESTMGKLIVPNGVDVNNAGIGPVEGGICSNISIYGGAITAYGGEHGAGIGGAYGDIDHTCGNITIYGGVVNAYGGKSASGIGVGKTATCRKVTIKGGVVNAYGGENGAGIGGASNGIKISGGSILAVGGDYSAGIGSGYGTGYCNGVDITGGYIKAVAGNKDAQPIGEAAMSGAVLVTIDPLCTTVKKRTVEQYINYDPVDAVDPTCAVNGVLAYVKDSLSGNYYTSFPFTEEGLIGDATAFAAWSAEGGAGCIPALGHIWQYVDGSTHKCTRCEGVEEHIDADDNKVCDLCNEVIPMYLSYNFISGKVSVESLATDAIFIDDASDHFVAGTNIVKGNVVFEDRIVLPENVRLVLANGATLTAKKGITVPENGSLAIHAQSNDPKIAGKLIVPENGPSTFYAGIGSEDSGKCGDITIYGGNITVNSGGSSAAIGSGGSAECGDITIRGGFVTARGGTGIGSGVNGSCKGIKISGGFVIADGLNGGAGIGSGFGALASCGPVTITGGYVKATSEERCEPIGASSNSSPVDVTIDDETCTTVLYGTVTYINYELHAKVDPTCALVGTKAYFQDYINGTYYTEFPFTEDGLIGDGDAFSAWKAEGGAGYLPILPHTDEDENGICDVCKKSLLTYLDYNEATGKVDTNRIVLDQFNVIDDPSDSFVTGWNVVKGEVTFKDTRIELPKDVNLVLADGATLNAKKGIAVATDGGLSIYAQSDDPATMGKLIVPDNISSHKAGIGTDKNRSCGLISIYGGALTIHGGYRSAAIGAGSDASCAGVEIFGGSVTAFGGEDAPAIGSGYGASSSCDHISIFGGNVTTQGDMYGAGIGSSYKSSCGIITISGGIVNAKGGHDFSAGIGSGFDAFCDGVSITGGYIKATPGVNAEPIGGGWRSTVEVSIDSSCTSVTKDGLQYINYEPFAEVASTCAVAGTKAYFIDNISGNYYVSFPFTEDVLIGDADALAAWKAEGGAGSLARTSHTDEDGDKICDVCETVLPIYLYYNEFGGKVDKAYTLQEQFHIIDSADDSFVTGWNVIKGNVEFKNRIELPKDVVLLLTDGATLTADEGITVADDGSFSIFAQSTDPATMGKLIVPEGGSYKFYAGIGSGDEGSCGTIAIYGGNITSYGGVDAAGIGAGDYGACGDIMILGGIVTAKGTHCSTGIGSGAHTSHCGNITIVGGVVDAASGGDGAGIGAGFEASCGTVTIMGGYVKAVAGSEDAQPIGTGKDSETVEVVISVLTCTSTIKGNTQYINYEPFAGIEPTCTASGTLPYLIDYVSGNYYASLPIMDDGFIGSADALAVWLSEDGDGYLVPTPHIDENEDEVCDVCGQVYADYMDYNATTGKVDTKHELWGVNLIDDKDDSFVSGWNVIKGNVEFENRIELPADVSLILADGATLTAKKGISVAADGDFAIYAQSNDMDVMGKLIVPAGLTENMTGIGTPYAGNCGNIVIYGGMITVQGGYHAAAIGSGLRNACGNMTIRGGVVTALGGASAAGIGSGFGASCGKVTITGGYIKATAGEDSEPIGSGYLSDNIAEVSIDSSCTSKIEGSTQYINFEEFAAAEPTCTTGSTLAYVKDSVSGNYYTAFPFTEANLIGDDDAFAAWVEQNRDNCLPALGHDWQYVDESTHQCSRCKATEAHTGVDDYICDACNGVLLETAKQDAIAALGTAAGENPSTAMAAILEEAATAIDAAESLTDVSSVKEEWLDKIEEQLVTDILAAAKAEAINALTEATGGNTSDDMTAILDTAETAVNEATTLDGVASAKSTGLAAISTYLETLTEAKTNAKTALTDAAGDKPSTDMTAILSDAFDAIDATESLSNVNSTKEEWLDKIEEQLAAEALAAAKAEASTALTEATSGNTSADMTAILNEAKAAVNEATTLDGVTSAKSTGLAAIADYLDALAEAKTGAKAALAEAAGDKPSTDVTAILEGAFDAVDATDNLSDMGSVKEEWLDKIEEQLAAEALAAAKAEAVNALTQAVGDNPSTDLTTILNEAKAAVNEATTLDAVASAKSTGLSAVADYLDALAEAKTGAKAAIAEVVGDNPSDTLKASVSTAYGMIDNANSPEEVESIIGAALPMITAQAAAEAEAKAKQLAEAKVTAKAALTAAAGTDPSDTLAGILNNACDNVDKAETIEAVQAAEEAGFAAILAQQQAEANAAKQAVEAELLKAKQDLETATTSLNAANASISELNNIIKSKDATIAEKQEALGDATGQLNTAKADLETATANLENAKAKVTELEGIVSEQDEALLKAMQDLENKQAALNEMTENYNTASAALSEAQKNLEDTTKALNEAKAANEQMKKDLETANGSLKQANDEIAGLNDIIKGKNATIAEKQTALDDATEQLNTAKSDLETAKANLENAKAKVTELEGTISEKDETLAKVSEDLKAAQDAFDEMSENYDNAKKALDEMKAANEQTKKDLEAANAALKTANDAISELSTTIANKDATIDDKQAAVEAAQKALDEAKAKVTELEGVISEQDETLKQAEQTVKDLQAEIERLQALLEDEPHDPIDDPSDPTDDPSEPGDDPSDPTDDPSEPDEVIGDVNGDGNVDMKDVLLMRKYLAGMSELDNTENADVNGDGSVDMKDVLMLRKFLAGMIEKLGA